MLQQVLHTVIVFTYAHPFIIVYAVIGLFLIATLNNVYGKHNVH